MSNLLTSIYNSLVKDYNKVTKEGQPLNRENAYALASINKRGQSSDVIEKYKKRILAQIEFAAKSGDMYTIAYHPSYVSKDDKEYLKNYLHKL